MTTRMKQEILDQVEVAQQLARSGGEEIEARRGELQAVRRLVLAGTGASLAACRAGQYAFMKYARMLPVVLPAAELDYLHPEPGTLVILVSQSGQSLETQMAVQTLKARGIPFWGITNNLQSHLALAADRVLFMNAGEEVSSATKTYTATLLLFVALAGGSAMLASIPGDIQATLAAAAEPVARWAEALQAIPVGYFLGMGTLGATAAQGALMMKEKTFLPVEGMSLSEFRHGNIEVVKPGLPIVLLAVTPGAVAEAVRHGEYFATLGADLYLITDTPVAFSKLPPDRILQVQNSGDEVTGQVTAVMPLQLLAERIASIRGYDVDGFRFIAKVVDKYTL